MQRDSLYRFASNIVFRDVIPGPTQIQTTTISGAVDNERHCSGSQYSDAYGSWSNVVVTCSFAITLKEYEATARTDLDEIHLRSDIVCKYSRGYCMDYECGETMWQPIEEQLRGQHKYKVLYEGKEKFALTKSNKGIAQRRNSYS